jgi:hypothetical protein
MCRIVAAQADPGYRAVVLRVQPIGDAPAIALTESVRPGTWHPPSDCGADRRFTVSLRHKPVDNPCTRHPDGGWQRAWPQLVGLLGTTLVVPEPVRDPVATSTLTS